MSRASSPTLPSSGSAPPLAALAAAVGGARVYVGVHYPLDVLVGAGMGVSIARLTGRFGRSSPSARRTCRRPRTELRREAARLGIDGRSKMGKAQLIRAVGQKRRARSS
jgi:hypothetical protein